MMMTIFSFAPLILVSIFIIFAGILVIFGDTDGNEDKKHHHHRRHKPKHKQHHGRTN